MNRFIVIACRFRGILAAGIATALFCAPLEASAQLDVYFHMGTGRFLEAQKAIEERIRSDADRNARNLALLCTVYYKLRRYDKLFACADQLEARIRAGDHMHSDTMISESDITPLPDILRSAAYLDLGEPARAVEYGERGLGKIKKPYTTGVFSDTQYLVEALPVLGIAAVLHGRPADAERYIKRLAEVEIPYMGGHLRRNLKDIGLAKLHVAMGRYEDALKFLQQQEHFAISRVVIDVFGGGGDSFANLYELPKLLMRGKCELELGRLNEAKQSLDQLLAHRLAAQQGDVYWVALYERGRLAERESKPHEAIEYYRRAIEVIEQQRSSLTTEANKIGFVGDKQAVYRGLIATLFTQQRYAEAFEYLERSKSRALVDMLAKQKDFAAPNVEPSKVRELLARASQAELEATSLVVAQDESASNTRRSRVSASARQSIVEAAPELASLVSVSSTPIAEIQARLPEDEALIEYYYDEKSLYAFVLTRQALQAVRLEAGGLEDEIRTLRKEVEAFKSEAYRAPAQSLYKRLIEPIEALAGKDKLVIVAHGALHYLPFAALHDGNRFLIEKYSLRFLPSASVLSYIRTTKLTRPAGILAFGNPDLGDAKYDLPFAQEEANTVVRTVPESRALVRKEATESALRQFAGAFQYLHFATHGKFDAKTPLDSALLLAKDGSSDGLLTVGKLYSMRLDVDMVTLSACETGLGKIASGDDVIGLTRGFLYAGAATIVASLWPVDDEATAQLMTRFYEHLKDKDKREALREAQRAAFQKFPHPYYWAAFQLTGNAN